MWRRGVLGFLVVALLVVRVDTPNLTPATSVASAHRFSLVQWEATNFFGKWAHLLREMLPGRKPGRHRRLALIDEYLELARLEQKEKDRLEGPRLRRGAPGGIAKQSALTSRDYLNELTEAKQKLRAGAEEAIEAELSAVLIEHGLDWRLGWLLPPVDLRFGQPPTMLVTSPRDRLQRMEALLLQPELDVFERDRLEKEILEGHNVSGLVVNLAGLSTYPTLVSDVHPLRRVLQTGAHEWLHAYFFLRPFGQRYRTSQEMFTLNETASDLAGRELGDTAFARMGGDLSISPRRYMSPEERDPTFTREMRETRVNVEELLSLGMVEEAEQYMKERWWRLRLGGYGLRKLNQAYFAFHATYAEDPASLSPVGDQLEELRSLVPDVGAFVRTMSKVSSYQEFLDLLERLKVNATHAGAGQSNGV